MSFDAEQKNDLPSNGEKENNGKNKITHSRQTTGSSSSLHYSQLHRTWDTAELNADQIPSLQSNDSDINTILLSVDNDGQIITPLPKEYTQRRLSEQFNIRINTYRGNKLNSAITAARIGMLLFFLRTFLLLQPYDFRHQFFNIAIT